LLKFFIFGGGFTFSFVILINWAVFRDGNRNLVDKNFFSKNPAFSLQSICFICLRYLCQAWQSIAASQPGEEKAPGRPCSSLPLPEGSLQESQRGTFYKGM